MWRIDLSRGVHASPMWIDSLLLVASQDRNLHAVLPGAEPRVLWEENFKGGLDAEPIVLGDRIILGETGTQGRLLAVDRAKRDELWLVRLGDGVAGPVLAGDRIYAVTSSGRVVAVTTAGVEKWRVELETRVVARPALLGDALLIAADDGTLFALDPETGVTRERVDPGAGSIWGDPVIRETEGGPAAVYATLEGQLIAVAADLELLAQRSFPSRFYAGPVLVGGTLYLSGHEGTVWAYDWEEDEILWRSEIPGALRASAAVGPRAVALGDLGGTLYLLDRESGGLLWHRKLNGAITGAALTRGEELYVATERGVLYAFRPTTPAR